MRVTAIAGDVICYMVPTLVPVAGIGIAMDHATTQNVANSIEYAPHFNLLSHIVIPLVFATVCAAGLIDATRWGMETQGIPTRALLGRTARLLPSYILSAVYVASLDPVGQLAAGRNVSIGLFLAIAGRIALSSSAAVLLPTGILLLSLVGRSANIYSANIIFWTPSENRDALIVAAIAGGVLALIVIDCLVIPRSFRSRIHAGSR